MGGRVMRMNKTILRFGQNNCRSYGDGLSINEVIELTPSGYKEQKVGTIRFSDAMGPHTIDIASGKAVLDFYHDKFSTRAGYRRLLNRVARVSR